MSRGTKIGFLGLFLIGVFWYIPSSFSSAVAATTQDELNQQIEERNTEIADLEKEIQQDQETLEETTKAAKTLQGEVRKFDLRIKNLATEISLTQAQINKKRA